MSKNEKILYVLAGAGLLYLIYRSNQINKEAEKNPNIQTGGYRPPRVEFVGNNATASNLDKNFPATPTKVSSPITTSTNAQLGEVIITTTVGQADNFGNGTMF